MISFAAAWWDPADTDAGRRAYRLRDQIYVAQHPVRAVIEQAGWLVLAWNDPGHTARRLGEGGVLLGPTFGPGGTGSAETLAGHELACATDFYDACGHLSQRFWGSYVLLWADQAAAFAFRDPLGGLDCLSWQHDGLCILTSDAPACLLASDTHRCGIDWDRVGRGLEAPETMIDEPLFTGMTSVVAGEAVKFGHRSLHRRSFWNAASIASGSQSPSDPADELRATLQACIGRWQSGDAKIGCEISGGLDSAIVAASLARAGARIKGYHYYTGDPVGDERYYARSIARHISASLVETSMPERGLAHGDLSDLPIGHRPSIGAVNLFHDRDLATRARNAGMAALFTGQGGDALLFQHAAAEMAAECRGPWRRQLHQLAALASWTGNSFWSLLIRRGRGVRLRDADASSSRTAFLLRGQGRAAQAMPWKGDTSSLPAAKRRHIDALFQSRLAFGASWTSQTIDVVHPLLSQPIVETALVLPVTALTEGFRDRGLARRAFASNLPDVVVNRYGKGALTPYFGQCLVRSLPFLREFLLDGVLAKHDVIARNRLDAALRVAYLMQHDIYPELLWLVLTEHWARGWSALLSGCNDGSNRRYSRV